MNPDQPQDNPDQPQPEPTPAPSPQPAETEGPELQPQPQPAPQPQPQPAAPVQSEANPVQPQQPAVGAVPPVQPPQEPAKKSKFKKLLVGLSAGFGVLVAIFIAMVVIGIISEQKVTTYSKSDLTNMQANGYSFQYPKQWVDSSNDKEALKSLGLDSELQEIKLVSDNLDAKAGTADALMVTGTSSLGVSDSELREVLANADAKAAFEKSINDSLEPLAQSVGEALAKGSQCTEDAGNPAQIAYETNGYVAQISSDITCTAGEASDGMHLVLNINIIDGKQYTVVFGAANKDWDVNSKLYRNDVIAGFKVAE